MNMKDDATENSKFWRTRPVETKDTTAKGIVSAKASSTAKKSEGLKRERLERDANLRAASSNLNKPKAKPPKQP